MISSLSLYWKAGHFWGEGTTKLNEAQLILRKFLRTS